MHGINFKDIKPFSSAYDAGISKIMTREVPQIQRGPKLLGMAAPEDYN